MSTSKNTISGVTQSMIKLNMSLHELNNSGMMKGIIAYQKSKYELTWVEWFRDEERNHCIPEIDLPKKREN